LGPAAVLVAVVVLLSVGPPGALVHTQATSDQGTFTVAGEVGDLYPGLEATLEAHVQNTQPFSIRVTSVTATPQDANAGCDASMLHVDPSSTILDLAPAASALVPLAVRMDQAAPDACQGASFPLAFSGTAIGISAEKQGPVLTPGAGAAAQSSDGLAFTGIHVAGMVALAGALVAAGLVLWRMSCRRHWR
jgi:hypothetical protein